MKHTPEPWEFRSDGLYSEEFPILWVTQGNSGELYLGAFEDDTYVITAAPHLLDALQKIRRVVNSRGRTNKGIYVRLPSEYVRLIDGIAEWAISQTEMAGKDDETA